MAQAAVNRTPPATPVTATLDVADLEERGQLFRYLFAKSHASGRPARVTVAKAVMSELTGAAGGYTVPRGYSARLLRSFAEHGILYHLANRVDLESYTGECPTVDAKTASAGVSPFFGGATFSWSQQGTTPGASEPAFAQLNLTAWDLIGNTVISNQLLADMQPDGEQRLLRLLGKAAAWAADWAFFNGLGAGSKMPLGVVASSNQGKVAVTRAVAGHITQSDVAGMVGALLPGSWGASIFCTSPTGLSDVVKLTEYQANQYIRRRKAGQCGHLMSLPLYVTEKLPTLGTAGDLLLVNPEMYVVGLRQDAVVEVSAHEPTQFAKNRSVIRTWLRGDGKPLLPAAVTLANGSTASPVVVLT